MRLVKEVVSFFPCFERERLETFISLRNLCNFYFFSSSCCSGSTNFEKRGIAVLIQLAPCTYFIRASTVSGTGMDLNERMVVAWVES